MERLRLSRRGQLERIAAVALDARGAVAVDEHGGPCLEDGGIRGKAAIGEAVVGHVRVDAKDHRRQVAKERGDVVGVDTGCRTPGHGLVGVLLQEPGHLLSVAGLVVTGAPEETRGAPLTLPSAPGGGTTVGASAPAAGINGLAPVVLVASSATGAAAAGCAPSSATRTTPSTRRSSARTDTDVMTARRESRTSSSSGGVTCGFVISWPPGSAGWQSCRTGDHNTVAGAPAPRVGYASWHISCTNPASSLFQPLSRCADGHSGSLPCATSRSPVGPAQLLARRLAASTPTTQDR